MSYFNLDSKSIFRCNILVSALLIGLFVSMSFAQSNSDYTGTWQGKLNVSVYELRIVFKINAAENHTLIATMDSPDQGAFNMPVNTVEVNDYDIKLILNGIGSYEGTLQDDKKTLAGFWFQGGQKLPLILTKSASPDAPRRPQTPKEPFPYKSTDIEINNAERNTVIAGTLTIPDSEGQVPLLILISGSGAQDRDESLFGHQPFWVLADDLSRNGFAVFRYDDAGVGKSTGNYSRLNIEDLAADLLCIKNYFISNSKIDKNRIGFIGDSEGGAVAMVAACRYPQTACVVLLAAPGVNGKQIIMDQVEALNVLAGVKGEALQENLNLQEKILDLVINENDKKKTVKELKKMLPKEKYNEIKVLLSDRYKHFLQFEPSFYLQKLKCPLLVLNGSKDIQVNSEKNLNAIIDALKKGNNQNFKTKEIDGANHLFQQANTGAITEYAQIEQTIDPQVLLQINAWLKENL